MSNDDLKKIRSWLVENVFRNPDIMLSDERFIETYGDPGEKTEIDMCEIIASLYEILHQVVTGESYMYFFHHANKCGSWVEDQLFIDLLKGGDNNDDLT